MPQSICEQATNESRGRFVRSSERERKSEQKCICTYIMIHEPSSTSEFEEGVGVDCGNEIFYYKFH